MKSFRYSIFVAFAMMAVMMTSCFSGYPVDEDGLLITTRTDCYVSNFSVYDQSQMEILTGSAYIDTLEQVVVGYVTYGQAVDYVHPRISLCEDAKLNPKVELWEDFSGALIKADEFTFLPDDWTSAGGPNTSMGKRIVEDPSLWPANPKKYTVISGTRKIKKEYNFILVERPLR